MTIFGAGDLSTSFERNGHVRLGLARRRRLDHAERGFGNTNAATIMIGEQLADPARQKIRLAG
jgi:hypothetical protein